jgi:hypothetical protein
MWVDTPAAARIDQSEARKRASNETSPRLQSSCQAQRCSHRYLSAALCF